MPKENNKFCKKISEKKTVYSKMAKGRAFTSFLLS
jgi:hypothetical protein